jgi:hypothetical protein
LDKATGTWMFHLSAAIKVLMLTRGKILDADEGSYTQLYVAASRDLGREMSGRYFDDGKKIRVSRQ